MLTVSQADCPEHFALKRAAMQQGIRGLEALRRQGLITKYAILDVSLEAGTLGIDYAVTLPYALKKIRCTVKCKEPVG